MAEFTTAEEALEWLEGECFASTQVLMGKDNWPKWKADMDCLRSECERPKTIKIAYKDIECLSWQIYEALSNRDRGYGVELSADPIKLFLDAFMEGYSQGVEDAK